MRNVSGQVKMSGGEQITANMNTGNKIFGKHMRQFLAQHSVVTLLRHCYNIVSYSYNIVPTLQLCVAPKIVVANRPV